MEVKGQYDREERSMTGNTLDTMELDILMEQLLT
jgi:hypothetical protein